MTENQTEGQAPEGGASAQPNAGVSNKGANPFEGQADALREALKPLLEEALKPVLGEVRGVQGKQDKNEKQLQNILQQYEANKAKGVNPTEAYRMAEETVQDAEMDIQRKRLLDELIAERLGKSPKPQGSGNAELIAKAKELAKQYDMDENDPALSEIVSSAKPEELEDKIAFQAFKKTKTQSTLASETTMQSSPTRIQGNEEILREIEVLSKTPSKNMARILELQKQIK